MVNNFDVCYYDNMAIHFDAFAVTSRQRVTVTCLNVYRYAYLHCEALVFD